MSHLVDKPGRRLNQQLQQLFQDHDVTPEQWSLLMCLDGHDGITHKDLAQRTDKDPANITRLVDLLERKALVRRALESERSKIAAALCNGERQNECSYACAD